QRRVAEARRREPRRYRARGDRRAARGRGNRDRRGHGPDHRVPGERQAAADADRPPRGAERLEAGRASSRDRTPRRGIPNDHRRSERMSGIAAVVKRELASYFTTPVAYVFIAIFLIVANAFTFYLRGFYERNQADLASFFTFHPWLFLFLVPALSMRLWAEERKSGSIELLMTLPIEPWKSVVGKFLAAWAFTAIAIAVKADRKSTRLNSSHVKNSYAV